MSTSISLDDLNQLSDRQSLLQDLNILIALYHNKNLAFSLSILKVNQLALINKERGIAGTKCVMSTLSNRLENLLKKTSSIYRLNTGQFVIISKPQISKNNLGPHNIDLVLEELQQSITFSHDIITVELTLGYVAMTAEIVNSSELLRRADIALKLARCEKISWKCFNCHPPKHHNITDWELFNELKFSLNNNELYLAGQPIFDFDTGKLAMVEVLLRWEHDKYGTIEPLKIIELAGQNGYLYKLSVFVAEQLINFLSVNKARYKDISFALNFNMPQIINAKLIKHLLNLFDQHGIARSRLIFESTETSASPIPLTEAANHFHWIRQQGIQIAIDDFGSGFSTLDYINNLDVDIIKIDRSLITDIESNSRKLATLTSLLQLCNHLGVVIVLEGIENELQHQLLIDCQTPRLLVQGYWYAHPSPLSDNNFYQSNIFQQTDPFQFQLASQGS
jgi:EAL domain-containing protein (putative c-di-GMP-specific phosphodiesterase class I)/GGDEF domain-containing protein